MAANLLTSFSFDKDYYDQHKEAGLDYLGYGMWQIAYTKLLCDNLEWVGKSILDIGCACGAIVRGFGHNGAYISGCDINEHVINLGRNKWPDMRELLKVCDATNLHYWKDATFAGLHSAQVFEHFRPYQIDTILQECHRVIQKGGLLFCSLDTEEIYARQNRRLETEDATHRCIKHIDWWHEKLRANKWEVVTDKYSEYFRTVGSHYFIAYDWAYFVARAI